MIKAFIYMQLLAVLCQQIFIRHRHRQVYVSSALHMILFLLRN